MCKEDGEIIGLRRRSKYKKSMLGHNSYMFRCMLQSWASKWEGVKRAQDSPLSLTNLQMHATIGIGDEIKDTLLMMTPKIQSIQARGCTHKEKFEYKYRVVF